MKMRSRFGGSRFSAATAAGIAGLLALGVAGCKSNAGNAPIVSNTGGDPADANMAQPYTGGDAGGYGNTTNPGNTTQVLGQSETYNGQASGETYGPEPNEQGEAPIIRQAPAGAADGSYAPQQGYADGSYTDAEEAGAQAIADTDQPPPPLPEYDQPPAPAPNYLWTPGYWNYASAGYYWVPGVWCAPPFYGALWTPPFWGFYGGHYLFHRGYWGPHVGFYGGVNYGFGYIGTGYYGGYWRGHDFLYNRAVTNVNINVVHNYYDRNVEYNGVHYGPHPENRVSYNGGRGGINLQPRPSEVAAMHEAHYAPEAAQRQVRMEAASNRGNFFRADGGRPAQAFATRPVGAIGNIATAPREEAFNHVGGRPGAPNGGAPSGFNRPGAPNAPNAFNRPGAPNGFSRPGEPNGFNRPGAPNTLANRPGEFNRPGEPNHEANRPGAPSSGTNRPGDFNRPGEPNNGANRQSGFDRPNQPNAGENRPGAPNDFNRPGAPNGTPGGFNRATPPAEANRPGQPNGGEFHRPSPGVRPGFENRGGASPQPNAARPDFNRGAPPAESRPAPQQAPAERPAPAPRPEPAAPAFHPAPAPAPHAAPAPAAHAAPAPAPHGGEGGGGHHH